MEAKGNENVLKNIVSSLNNFVHRFRRGPGAPADTGEIETFDEQTLRKLSPDEIYETKSNKCPREKPPRAPPNSSIMEHKRSTISHPHLPLPGIQPRTKGNIKVDPTKLGENITPDQKQSGISKTSVQDNQRLAEPSATKATMGVQNDDEVLPEDDDLELRRRFENLRGRRFTSAMTDPHRPTCS